MVAKVVGITFTKTDNSGNTLVTLHASRQGKELGYHMHPTVQDVEQNNCTWWQGLPKGQVCKLKFHQQGGELLHQAVHVQLSGVECELTELQAGRRCMCSSMNGTTSQERACCGQ